MNCVEIQNRTNFTSSVDEQELQSLWGRSQSFPYHFFLWTPPKGDLIRNNYADKLLKLLFEFSRDFGSQMPAAICCDINRNPAECATLRLAMARTGWTDVGHHIVGESEAPNTYYHYGAAHAGMKGHGCSRIDLILVNQVALAALKSYEQIYGQGIAKHTHTSLGQI